MLPRKRRVSKAVFPQIKRGKSYHSPIITLRVNKKEKCFNKESVFSFITSRKVSNKAPQRNLLRRRGYTAVKSIITQTKPCFVCVFYFKKEAINVIYSDLKKNITQLLQEAHVI